MFEKKLLAIDDGVKTHKMMNYLFMCKGFKVEAASLGIEGLNILADTRPDAIILDLKMPEMDGFEFCKKLKEDTKLKEIPVIALSASPNKDCRGRILSLGASDFFRSSELVAKTLEIVDPV